MVPENYKCYLIFWYTYAHEYRNTVMLTLNITGYTTAIQEETIEDL